jgi:23S rRNA maturation mini-RNase III
VSCADKVAAFNDLLQKLNLSADSVAYVGDDVIDLPVMTKVGFAIFPVKVRKYIIGFCYTKNFASLFRLINANISVNEQPDDEDKNNI